MGCCGVVMWNENGVWQDLAGLDPQLACEAFELQLMHNCIETDLQSHKGSLSTALKVCDVCNANECVSNLV